MLEGIKEFHKIMQDSGATAYIIVVMGVLALGIIFERARALYFTYSINAFEFMTQVKALIQNDQLEEAILHCAGKEDVPLVAVVKTILERSDRDDESIEKGQEIAIAEVMPKIGKRLGYLSMVANVSTLLGLLGTIQGLIMAFSAVSAADPTQKQRILSEGIAMAMYTTAFGLCVAIPVMVVYSFLFARQNRHFEEIVENSSKVVDWLSTRHYQPFHINNVFPAEATLLEKNGRGRPTTPPTAKQKVA